MYLALAPTLGPGWRRRGVRIGAAYWALATPWFEFYLPFNVLREPWPLVAFEALLWAATLTTFSLALAWVHERLGYRAASVEGTRERA